jgi:hypothetical protein
MRLLAAFALIASLSAAGGPARAQDAGLQSPARVDRRACYRMVQEAGRWVAWARWEEHLPIDVARSRSPSNSEPEPQARLVDAWIDDAYRWHVTDAQVQEWAAELGHAGSVPHADELSVHETIAIWLRRVARGCGS